jgi:hypothetical protein
MSATMNGAPIWCRPAPTRTGAIWDAEDEPLQGVSLADAPRLVAAAIKAGLIKLASDEPRPFGWREGCLERQCRGCQQPFWNPKNSKLRRCISCRIPKKPCLHCGNLFQPEQRHYKTCSKECAMAARKVYIDAYSAEARAKRPKVICPICGVEFGMKFSAGGLSKTCGKECGTEFFKRNAAAKRAQREANQQNKISKPNNTENR